MHAWLEFFVYFPYYPILISLLIFFTPHYFILSIYGLCVHVIGLDWDIVCMFGCIELSSTYSRMNRFRRALLSIM